MATITSNGTGGGVWSSGATWAGGVAAFERLLRAIAGHRS